MSALVRTTESRPIGKMRLDEHGRWILAEVEPHVSIRLKQLFPRIPKHAVPPYCLPGDTVTAADLAWFASRYAFEVPAEDHGRLLDGEALFKRNSVEMEAIFLPDWQPPPGGAGLREGQVGRVYQHQAVEMFWRRGSLLLGDVVGLGKTYTGALALVRPGALPAAVVVEAHLQAQWVEKLTTFTNLRVYAVKTTMPSKEELPPADVYVWRYSQVIGWTNIFPKLGIKTVIYDEIQKLRTGLSSGMGNACHGLSTLAERRLGLSGTPIVGYGSEIFQVMKFIDRSVLGIWEDFYREWLPDGKHLSDPKALGTYLREQHVYLRRTKQDVGQEMPPVNRLVETVEHSAATLASIDDVVRQLASRVVFGEFTDRGEAARELDWRLRQATGLAKAKAVASYVRLLLESGAPVLLAGWHRDVYEVWQKELKDFNPMLYTGTESPAQKERVKQAAMKGETDLVIISLRSGAGLDGLQYRFSDVVIGELDWAPGIHEQVIGRLYREGQPNPVTAHFLVADDGSDPVVMSRLGIKASEARGVNDPTLGLEEVTSDRSRMVDLARRYLSKRQLKELDAIEAKRAAGAPLLELMPGAAP